ncbi:hypothetical protein DENSPDRAFT_402058 [Dentipellis sp. KUC8613]|nr:hypothetical protein DENSPDRAFT_402058 [Dentipellis sp. KUC8613]
MSLSLCFLCLFWFWSGRLGPPRVCRVSFTCPTSSAGYLFDAARLFLPCSLSFRLYFLLVLFLHRLSSGFLPQNAHAGSYT